MKNIEYENTCPYCKNLNITIVKINDLIIGEGKWSYLSFIVCNKCNRLYVSATKLSISHSQYKT
jgi:phage FluMu protein Com